MKALLHNANLNIKKNSSNYYLVLVQDDMDPLQV